nr:hypothetical protein [Tanacetum cinerariifolium]
MGRPAAFLGEFASMARARANGWAKLFGGHGGPASGAPGQGLDAQLGAAFVVAVVAVKYQVINLVEGRYGVVAHAKPVGVALQDQRAAALLHWGARLVERIGERGGAGAAGQRAPLRGLGRAGEVGAQLHQLDAAPKRAKREPGRALVVAHEVGVDGVPHIAARHRLNYRAVVNPLKIGRLR